MLFCIMQKRAADHYLNFTRKERNGTVFLLFAILSCISVPFIYPVFFKEERIAKTDFQKELGLLKSIEKDSAKKYFSKENTATDDDHYYKLSERNERTGYGALFSFDPNTISDEGWKKLGLKDKTIATIRKYLSKGGKFRKPEDIEKIWGLREDEVQRLMPYVSIKGTTFTQQFSKEEISPQRFEHKTTNTILVDINSSDTAAWIALPGIAAKLSNRIINFRDRLGGFYSISQVAETFGLPDSVFQKIRPRLLLNNKNIKQLNINTATLDEMKQHPYIRYNLANLIIQYRNQHGNFSSIDDIKKIMTVTEDQYMKLSPYLKVQ